MKQSFRAGSIEMHGSLSPLLSLQPIHAADSIAAIRLATACFGSEAITIALTLGWHATRKYVPIKWPMVRSVASTVTEGGRTLGDVWLVRSLIHGNLVCWGEILPVRNSDTRKLLAAGLTLVGKRRLLIKASRSQAPELSTCCNFVGSLGSGADGVPIFSVGPGKIDLPNGLQIHSRSRPIEIQTQFYLARQLDRVVGMTGLYTCSFWPRMAWGGWGCLSPAFARRGAAFELLRATEDLARETDAPWFMIETSDAPLYKSARRIYELYGLDRQLQIDGFYGRPNEPGSAWLAYGRRLKESPQ